MTNALMLVEVANTAMTLVLAAMQRGTDVTDEELATLSRNEWAAINAFQARLNADRNAAP